MKCLQKTNKIKLYFVFREILLVIPMILKVYVDDFGLIVYKERIDHLDDAVMKELVEKKVVKVSDNCLLELL